VVAIGFELEPSWRFPNPPGEILFPPVYPHFMPTLKNFKERVGEGLLT